MKMTAKTSFYFQQEMWLKGESKDVSAHYAHELTQAGLVENGGTEAAKVAKVSPNFATLTTKPVRKRDTKPATPKLETK